MKIAIISDLHLLHWHHRKVDLHDPNPEVQVAESVAQEKPDFIIDAGDTEIPEALREAIPADIPILSTPGNHDYYGLQWHPEYENEFKVENVGNLRIALTTFWTDLRDNNPIIAMAIRDGLADCRYIKGFTMDKWYYSHMRQRHLLEVQLARRDVDIVVTHHAPSHCSIHERRRKHAEALTLNCGFASHLDEMVEDSGAKLWVHGHTHDKADYMLGGTRVIANPCGYPRERKFGFGDSGGPYKPVYVEI